MASSLSVIAAKDGAAATIAGGLLAVDKSGAGTGPFFAAQALVDTQGIVTATIKAASTAPVATDTALVVSISPNSINPNVGNNVDAVAAAGSTAAPVVNYGYGFNGTTWDRLQVDGSKNLKVALTSTTLTGTSVVSLVPATTGGLTRTRTLIPNNVTAVVVKSGAGQLYKVRCTNNSAVIAYLKIYDATSATAGSGTPVDTIMIPASTSGAGIVDSTDVGTPFATGLTFIVTTGIADADTAVPAANAYIVTMYYK